MFLAESPAPGCDSDEEEPACAWTLAQIRVVGRNHDGLPILDLAPLKVFILPESSSEDESAESECELSFRCCALLAQRLMITRARWANAPLPGHWLTTSLPLADH